jgi:hypothetical protein
MARRFDSRFLLPLVATGLVAMLGGCVAYPASPGYSAGYGYDQPYYGGGYVGYGGGWHGRGWHDGWRDRDLDWRR